MKSIEKDKQCSGQIESLRMVWTCKCTGNMHTAYVAMLPPAILQSALSRRLLLLLGLVLVHLEVPERVGVLGGGDDAQEVLKRVLLKVLLGEVLDVSLGEGDVRGEDELVVYWLARPRRSQDTRLQEWARKGMWEGLWQVGVLCFVGKEGRVSLRSTRLTLALQIDNLAKLTSLAIDLDAVVQELLERGGVEHLVGGRDRVVDVELVQGFAGGGGGSDGGFGLLERPSIEHRAQRDAR